MKWVLFLCAAACAHAQEIRGTVLDVGANAGLADAQVIIGRYLGVALHFTEFAKASTDSSGGFRVKLPEFGQFSVQVSKEGYRWADNPIAGNAMVSFTLSEEQPLRELKIQLGRDAGLSGRVVDSETEEPLRNFRVVVYPRVFRRGQPTAISGGQVARTDAEGRFEMPKLGAGFYVVQTDRQVPLQQRFIADPKASDMETVDEDYEVAYFPGGGSLETALPVQLRPGARLDIGTIRARKIHYYRALVSVAASSCLSRAPINVYINGSGGEVPCGAPALIRGIPPGTHTLDIMQELGTSLALSKSFVTVREENVRVPVTLVSGTAVVGKLKLSEGTGSIDLSTLKVGLRKLDSANRLPEAELVQIGEDGRFRLEHRLPGPLRVVVTGLPAGHYVQTLRHRGVVQRALVFDFTGDGDIEVEIGDQPAAIIGRIMERDRPVSDAAVSILRWPAQESDPYESLTTVKSDAAGRFQAANLVPGEYRLFAVRGEDTARIEEPGVLLRLAGRAETIRVARGGQADPVLPIEDAGR